MPLALLQRAFRCLQSALRPIENAARSDANRERAWLIEATRRRWARDSRVQIDIRPTVWTTRDGTWVSAWVLAGDLAPIAPEALSAAVQDLPLWPREIYLLHRQHALHLDQIAERLGIDVEDVRGHLAIALLRLDAALGSD